MGCSGGADSVTFSLRADFASLPQLASGTLTERTLTAGSQSSQTFEYHSRPEDGSITFTLSADLPLLRLGISLNFQHIPEGVTSWQSGALSSSSSVSSVSVGSGGGSGVGGGSGMDGIATSTTASYPTSTSRTISPSASYACTPSRVTASGYCRWRVQVSSLLSSGTGGSTAAPIRFALLVHGGSSIPIPDHVFINPGQDEGGSATHGSSTGAVGSADTAAQLQFGVVKSGSVQASQYTRYTLQVDDTTADI